jgi:redox-sensitive bicupin YhaK (pirin superfamily)
MSLAAPVPFPAREVPLGGLRAMTVRRSLPQRGLPTVGAWCFLDRFGPQRVTMRVEPHPHMGLQTVTWPLAGEIRHRDSLGSDVVLRPGALNLMTSGNGIAHSEYSLGDDTQLLDALQLWIALPEGARHGDRGFESHPSLPAIQLGDGSVATVVMGTLAGATSPATTFTPLVGADITLASGAAVTVPLNPAWEYAIVGLSGEVSVGHPTAGPTPGPGNGDLLYLGAGLGSLELTSSDGARLFLLGGEPFDEELVMWWNFVGRSHEEIAVAWDEWQGRSGRFGEVEGHGDVRIPAPPLPTVRLLPRTRD